MSSRASRGLALLASGMLALGCGPGLRGLTVERGPAPTVGYMTNGRMLDPSVSVDVSVGEVVTVLAEWAGRCSFEHTMDFGSGKGYEPCYEKDFTATVSCEGVPCTVEGQRAASQKRAKGGVSFHVVALEPGRMRIRTGMTHGAQKFATISPPLVVGAQETPPPDGAPGDTSSTPTEGGTAP